MVHLGLCFEQYHFLAQGAQLFLHRIRYGDPRCRRSGGCRCRRTGAGAGAEPRLLHYGCLLAETIATRVLTRPSKSRYLVLLLWMGDLRAIAVLDDRLLIDGRDCSSRTRRSLLGSLGAEGHGARRRERGLVPALLVVSGQQ